MTSNRSSPQNKSVTCSHKVNRNIFMSTENFPIIAFEVTWVKLRDDPIVWLYRFQTWQHSSSISTNMKKMKPNHKEQKKKNKKKKTRSGLNNSYGHPKITNYKETTVQKLNYLHNYWQSLNSVIKWLYRAVCRWIIQKPAEQMQSLEHWTENILSPLTPRVQVWKLMMKIDGA
jgi:hypothetical protein